MWAGAEGKNLKSLSAAIVVAAGLASLTTAPRLIPGDTSSFVMFVAVIVTAAGLVGWVASLRGGAGAGPRS